MRVARAVAGGRWQAPVDISTVGFLQGPPQIAVDPRGRAVAAWELVGDGFIEVQAAALDE